MTSTLVHHQQQSPQQQNQPFSLPKLNINKNAQTTKDKIPIVRHLIRDEDIEDTSVQENQLNPLELDKIIKLFVDPHSVNYHLK